MISGILVLSLCAFTYAQSPPYVDSVKYIKDVTEQLQGQILSMNGNVPNINDVRRHYAVILTHIAQVAAECAKDCEIDYDDIYLKTLPSNIALALTDVDLVISVTADAIEALHNDTDKLQTLIDTLCTETTSNKVCSQIIDQAVSGDPVRYEHESIMMLFTGDAAKRFLDTNLFSVADEHDEIGFLLEHINDLVYLISTVGDLIRRHEGKLPCAI